MSVITKPLEGHDGLTLTIAHPLPAGNAFLKNACSTTAVGLDKYNRVKTGFLPQRKIFYSHRKEFQKQATKMQVALLCQYSVEVNIDAKVLESILSINPDFLTVLQTKSYEYGAKRIFVWGYRESKLVDVFINVGFIPCGEFLDLEENLVVQRFYKDLENRPLTEQEHFEFSISEEGKEFSFEELNPYNSKTSINMNSFGIFIHANRFSCEKSVKGGIFGKIFRDKEKGIPHGYIDCLWTDNSSGTNNTQKDYKGLGTLLMIEAENLFRQQGAKYAQLATAEFQAPEFYKKMGYEIVDIFPGYYLLKDVLYGIFDCTKKLL